MFVVLSFELADRLPPLVQVALDPDCDGVVEHPGHGGDHPAHLPVPQDYPRHVHPDVTTTSWTRRWHELVEGIICQSGHKASIHSQNYLL